jgi:stress-induced morphogen
MFSLYYCDNGRIKDFMAMTSDAIHALIHEAFPDAEITIDDLAGDGEHYKAHISSKDFIGKSRIAQHQLVYKALKGRMGTELHALSLNTSVPKET